MPKKKKQTTLEIHTLRPRLPGPWQYLGLLPMLTVARNLARETPPAAYPLVALVVWRTIQSEQRKRRQAIFDAQREAIRRAQQIYVVKPQRKRFIFF
ncbi:MAG TPA: hypothetical protein VFM49_12990 [Chloroflexia bacterium]|jgi:hypothetical protein|nr:hypothetical protein [Chloroflexia bacterium]